jgi:hypothetical protein
MATLASMKTELDHATAALAEPGAGALGSLECRVADLRHRFLATPAADLTDLEARLAAMRELVATLGEGYLLALVSATLDDVRAMRARERETTESGGPG